MQRGWSSFADTRRITFSNTIGEDQRIRHFIAAVCRRRWPSGRRPQAPQRPSDLRTSATVIFLKRRMPDWRCSESGRQRSQTAWAARCRTRCGFRDVEAQRRHLLSLTPVSFSVTSSAHCSSGNNSPTRHLNTLARWINSKSVTHRRRLSIFPIPERGTSQPAGWQAAAKSSCDQSIATRRRRTCGPIRFLC